VSLATGSKIVVAESPEELAEAVRSWHASIRLAALRGD
jgi:uncharacterized protein YlzI (FlbEa/FlbD family)